MVLYDERTFVTRTFVTHDIYSEEDLSADTAVHMVDRRAKLNVELPYLHYLEIDSLVYDDTCSSDCPAGLAPSLRSWQMPSVERGWR